MFMQVGKTKGRTVGLWLLLVLLLSACQPIQRLPETKAAAAASAQTALEQANQAVVQRFYEEVVSQKKLAALDELFDPNMVNHDLDFGAEGGDLGGVLTGLPDVQATVSLWVIEGDLVTAVVTFSGTHQAELLGVAATGNPVTFSLIDIWRVKDGKLTDIWHNVPNSDILEQIQPEASSTTVMAEQAVFTGTVEAQETYVITAPTMLVDTTGSGESAELGQFTVTWEFTVNLDTGAGVGSAHFIAANGDRLDTTSLGQGNPSKIADVNRVVEQHTITGGTGRYAGAMGSFMLQRLVSTITGVTSGSFEGIIVLQKAK